MFIIVDKNNNVIRTSIKKPITYGNNMLLEVESLPEKYDYLVAENIQEHTVVTKEASTKKIIKLDKQTGEKLEQIIEIPAVVEKRFTCDLVAKFKPQAFKDRKANIAAKNAVLAEIADLKKSLADTDYQAIKYAEGYYTEEDYAEIKAQRQAWRDRINELETSL